MTIAYSGDSITFPDSSVQATAPKVGMVNRIINGAMVIDQRNAGASVTLGAGGTYTLDRWRFLASQASKLSTQQNQGAITPPTGFKNYISITSSSAYAITATDYFFVQQPVEGFNSADFGWGTLSAASITVSFWVRSSLTGTFGGGQAIIQHQSGTASGASYCDFTLNAGRIGNIAQSGTTSVAYNTSSDYRLKDTIAPMTGALARVAALRPCTYKWKVDGSDGQGFIAHELAEVEAGCVTGEKDAVDADGNPQYQGIDTSFLVATLAAAIQELKAVVDEQSILIAAQATRITALEGTAA